MSNPEGFASSIPAPQERRSWQLDVEGDGLIRGVEGANIAFISDFHCVFGEECVRTRIENALV